MRYRAIDEVNQKIKELYQSGKYSYKEIGDMVGLSWNAVRNRVRRSEHYKPRRYEKAPKKTEKKPHNDTLKHTISADGSQTSQRVLELTLEQLSTPKLMMKAHGFDPLKWELISCVNNVWDSNSGEGSTITLYQSKITVKPRKIDFSEIVDEIRKNTTPIKHSLEHQDISYSNDRYLILGCTDLHFGVATFDDYVESLEETIRYVTNGYRHVVIYLAGDLFDTDNLRGTTARGTPVGEIDMVQAWNYLSQYVERLIHASIEYSAETTIMFVRGNHSESMEWAFVQYLKSKYGDVENLSIDDSLDYSKAMLLGKNFIGFSHGYKNKKNLALNLSKMFPELWGKATNHEILIGHEHRESKDEGAILRVLPTRSPSTEYARESNFLINHKAFMCLEYNEDDIKSIYYV